jgi:hypothetical protein
MVQKVEREQRRVFLLQAHVLPIQGPVVALPPPEPHNHTDIAFYGGQNGIKDADLRMIALVAIPRQHRDALAAVVDDCAVHVRCNAVVDHALLAILRAKLGAHLPPLDPEVPLPVTVRAGMIGALGAECDARTNAAVVFVLHAIEKDSQRSAARHNAWQNVADVRKKNARLADQRS